MALLVKNPPTNTREGRDGASVSRSGKSPGGGHGNLFQYSCLENPTDRGASLAIVNRIAKRQT